MFIPAGPMPDDAQTRTDGAPGRGGQGCRATVSSGIGLASYGSRFGAAVQQKRPRERGRPTRKIGRPRARLQGRCRCKRGREKAQEMPWRCPGAAERRLLDARGGGRQWQSDNTKQYTAALISGRQAGVAAQVASTSTGKQHRTHKSRQNTQNSGAVVVHGLHVRLGVPAGVSAAIRAGVCLVNVSHVVVVVNVSLVNPGAPEIVVLVAAVVQR